MVRVLYRFHVYFHVRRILKRLQVHLPHEAGFNADDNPYTNEEFFKICENYGVSHFSYLKLSSQASARSNIIGNTASALTTQKAFLNNFENIVNRRVDIREDIKHYQDTLSLGIE